MQEKNYHIHHRGIQTLVGRLIERALPPLVEWKVDESEERVARGGKKRPKRGLRRGGLRRC